MARPLRRDRTWWEAAMTTLTLDRLRDAVAKDAAIRRVQRLQPVGGPGDKIFPPTYAGGVYAVEDRRIDGEVVRCVLLDSVQSQANRMEEALQDAFLPNWRELRTDGNDAQCELPVIAVHVENHGWVTSLTAPHRIHDAILRDSNHNKTRFRESEIGKAIVAARIHNATGFYDYCPTALLFGTWDSTAGEGLDSAPAAASTPWESRRSQQRSTGERMEAGPW
jgi:CRISPR-associated protein Csb1